MHDVCIKAERYRERITRTLNPYVETASIYYPQPERVPKLWYDMHNLETVVQQLFTPKLRTRIHFDETTHQLKMHRGFVTETKPKRFLPLPIYILKEYLKVYQNDDRTGNANEMSPHPENGINLQTNRETTIEHFNKNILEQYT